MAATFLMAMCHVERANAALAAGKVIVARQIVEHALREMQDVKRAQDFALDEAAQTIESRAARETPPHGSGEQR